MTLVISAMLAFASCASPKRISTEAEGKTQQTPAFIGPPDPAISYGPEPEQRQEVVVIIGPGMASALSGAGVIRALQDQRISIASVGGVEFGAMVSASYAVTGSANKMDWSLLQFRGDWVLPKEGLSRFLSGSARSSRSLSEGLSKIFQERTVDSLKIPLWAFGSKNGLLHAAASGPVSGAVCRALSSMPWMESCAIDPANPDREVAGQLRDQWERFGVRLPVVWVVPARLEPRTGDAVALAIGREIRAFLAHVQESRAEQDLVIAPSPVVADYFDYGRRSEVVYSGKQEARKQFEQWMSRLGWTREKRSP
jgi:hypothetical protein